MPTVLAVARREIANDAGAPFIDHGLAGDILIEIRKRLPRNAQVSTVIPLEAEVVGAGGGNHQVGFEGDQEIVVINADGVVWEGLVRQNSPLSGRGYVRVRISKIHRVVVGD